MLLSRLSPQLLETLSAITELSTTVFPTKSTLTQTPRNSTLFQSEIHPQNSSNIHLNYTFDSSHIDYVQQNIDKISLKPPIKRFTYLANDNAIQCALEPKKMIRGLDELHKKIERIFAEQPRNHHSNLPSSDSHGNIDGSPSKPILSFSSIAKFLHKVHKNRAKKKSKASSNLRDDKNEAYLPDGIKLFEFGLIFSFPSQSLSS